MTFLPLAVFGLNHIPTLGLGHTTYSLCLTHTDTWSETSTCPLRFHSRVVPLLIIKCSVLYIFWKQVLGQIHVLQIFFFPSIGWLFTFLTVFYKEQTFLILISPNYCVVVVFFSGYSFLCPVSEILVQPKAMYILLLTRSFNVLAFAFTSVIYLWLSLLWDIYSYLSSLHSLLLFYISIIISILYHRDFCSFWVNIIK